MRGREIAAPKKHRIYLKQKRYKARPTSGSVRVDNVTGGNKRKVQVRKVRKSGFTDRKKQVFLDHLAWCCNLTRAAVTTSYC